MLDGILLAEHLDNLFSASSTGESTGIPQEQLSKTLRAYEAEMVPRAALTVLESREAASSMGLSLLEHFRTPKAVEVSTLTVEVKVVG